MRVLGHGRPGSGVEALREAGARAGVERPAQARESGGQGGKTGTCEAQELWTVRVHGELRTVSVY